MASSSSSVSPASVNPASVNPAEMNRHLIDAFTDCKREISLVIEGKALNTQQAATHARTLALAAQTFRQDLFRFSEGGQLSELLHETEIISFPIASQLIQLISQDEIQFFDGLKREISKTARVFFELVVFQCGLQDRSMYRDTVESIRGIFKKVIRTLPKEEVETRFELKCAKAALKKLGFGIGKWREISKDISEELGIALFEVLLSASPTGASGSPLVRPFVNASKAIYHALEETWYRDVWLLRWSGAEEKLKTKKGYEALKSSLTKQISKDHRLAFSVSQLITQVINQLSIEDPFLAELVTGKPTGDSDPRPLGSELSLLYLLNQKGGNYWETRYVTLLSLRPFVLKDPNLVPKVFEKYCDAKEEKVVKELAGRIVALACQDAGVAEKVKEFILTKVRGTEKTRLEALRQQAVSQEIQTALAQGLTLSKVKDRLKNIRSVSSTAVEEHVGTQTSGRAAQSATSSNEPIVSLTQQQLQQLLDLEEAFIKQQTQEEALNRLEAVVNGQSSWETLSLLL